MSSSLAICYQFTGLINHIIARMDSNTVTMAIAALVAVLFPVATALVGNRLPSLFLPSMAIILHMIKGSLPSVYVHVQSAATHAWMLPQTYGLGETLSCLAGPLRFMLVLIMSTFSEHKIATNDVVAWLSSLGESLSCLAGTLRFMLVLIMITLSEHQLAISEVVACLSSALSLAKEAALLIIANLSRVLSQTMAKALAIYIYWHDLFTPSYPVRTLGGSGTYGVNVVKPPKVMLAAYREYYGIERVSSDIVFYEEPVRMELPPPVVVQNMSQRHRAWLVSECEKKITTPDFSHLALPNNRARARLVKPVTLQSMKPRLSNLRKFPRSSWSNAVRDVNCPVTPDLEFGASLPNTPPPPCTSRTPSPVLSAPEFMQETPAPSSEDFSFAPPPLSQSLLSGNGALLIKPVPVPSPAAGGFSFAAPPVPVSLFWGIGSLGVSKLASVKIEQVAAVPATTFIFGGTPRAKASPSVPAASDISAVVAPPTMLCSVPDLPTVVDNAIPIPVDTTPVATEPCFTAAPINTRIIASASVSPLSQLDFLDFDFQACLKSKDNAREAKHAARQARFEELYENPPAYITFPSDVSNLQSLMGRLTISDSERYAEEAHSADVEMSSANEGKAQLCVWAIHKPRAFLHAHRDAGRRLPPRHPAAKDLFILRPSTELAGTAKVRRIRGQRKRMHGVCQESATPTSLTATGGEYPIEVEKVCLPILTVQPPTPVPVPAVCELSRPADLAPVCIAKPYDDLPPPYSPRPSLLTVGPLALTALASAPRFVAVQKRTFDELDMTVANSANGASLSEAQRDSIDVAFAEEYLDLGPQEAEERRKERLHKAGNGRRPGQTDRERRLKAKRRG